MPRFDFQCLKCTHVFEGERHFGDASLPPCPACGSKRTEKILRPPAIQFRGSGFYKTDARKPAVSEPKKRNATEKNTAIKQPGKETETPAPDALK